jgi:hypothetical protein
VVAIKALAVGTPQRQAGQTANRSQFNLQRRALRHASQCVHVVCDNDLSVALFLCQVDYRDTAMFKVLKGLLGKGLRDYTATKTAPITRPKNGTGDFRAVEIAPSVTCCSAAMQASGRLYLLRKAPRLPLMGCTMPTSCSCMFRKSADRRDSERRPFGATETSRWFVGRDSRRGEGRKSAET